MHRSEDLNAGVESVFFVFFVFFVFSVAFGLSTALGRGSRERETQFARFHTVGVEIDGYRNFPLGSSSSSSDADGGCATVVVSLIVVVIIIIIIIIVTGFPSSISAYAFLFAAVGRWNRFQHVLRVP